MILAKFGKKTASRILRIFVSLGLNESMPTLTGNIPLLLEKIMRKIALRIIWREREFDFRLTVRVFISLILIRS